jgi:hypothetical protein
MNKYTLKAIKDYLINKFIYQVIFRLKGKLENHIKKVFVFLSLVFVELKIFFDFKINSVKGRKKPKVYRPKVSF